MESNRRAWEIASYKYLEESEAFLDLARAGTLTDVEEAQLAPLLSDGATVVHLQSGNGTDDVALLRLGTSYVVGIDFSHAAASSALDRAQALQVPVNYAVGDALDVPLATSIADVVYTGKGALMWIPDLNRWASEVARLLRPGGHLFVYDAHPAAPLWTLDEDRAGLRDDRSYFGGTRANDTFPASAIARFEPQGGREAIEWQWTLAKIINAVLDAGLRLVRVGEHPEPFWRPADARSAAWTGRLPNSYSLLAAQPEE